MSLNPNHTQSAYGGAGWQLRAPSLRDEIGSLWAACGINSEYAPLRQVLLHRPGAELAASLDPDAVNMLAPLDISRAQAQHDALADAYRANGVDVVDLAPQQTPSPNQMFMADLFFMTPQGAIIARPASAVRAGEERPTAARLAALGVPILRSIAGSGTFEGADALWLDAHTVIIGRGMRTNDAGAAQLAATLAEQHVETIIVDLPFGSMHLMGMLRVLDRDLAMVWPGRIAVRAVEALRARGYHVLFQPDIGEALERKALNFVTIAPRTIVMSAGNPVSQASLEAHGVHCITVPVDELAKAAGAAGCLTGIVRRELLP